MTHFRHFEPIVDIVIPYLAITECGRPPASWEVEIRTPLGLESRRLGQETKHFSSRTWASHSMLELMSSKSDSHLVRAKPDDMNVLSTREFH